jgi:hypothetical protein
MATHYIDQLSGSDELLQTDYTKLLGKVVQMNGKKFIYARASATLTANTPYTLYYSGGATVGLDPSVRALTDSTTNNLIVIPRQDLAYSAGAGGDTDWFQFQGPCEDVIMPNIDWTATYALLVYDGGLIQTSAAPTNDLTEVGHIMARASTGAVRLADIFLHGRWATGTT